MVEEEPAGSLLGFPKTGTAAVVVAAAVVVVVGESMSLGTA